jgi:hypothetical protein
MVFCIFKQNERYPIFMSCVNNPLGRIFMPGTGGPLRNEQGFRYANHHFTKQLTLFFCICEYPADPATDAGQ